MPPLQAYDEDFAACIESLCDGAASAYIVVDTTDGIVGYEQALKNIVYVGSSGSSVGGRTTTLRNAQRHRHRIAEANRQVCGFTLLSLCPK